jgi:hypothetical protein
MSYKQLYQLLHRINVIGIYKTYDHFSQILDILTEVIPRLSLTEDDMQFILSGFGTFKTFYLLAQIYYLEHGIPIYQLFPHTKKTNTVSFIDYIIHEISKHEINNVGVDVAELTKDLKRNENVINEYYMTLIK